MKNDNFLECFCTSTKSPGKELSPGLLWSIATVSDDYLVLYERKIVDSIPTLCQISTYDSRTMSAFFVDGPDHLLGIIIDKVVDKIMKQCL